MAIYGDSLNPKHDSRLRSREYLHHFWWPISEAFLKFIQNIPHSHDSQRFCWLHHAKSVKSQFMALRKHMINLITSIVWGCFFMENKWTSWAWDTYIDLYLLWFVFAMEDHIFSDVSLRTLRTPSSVALDVGGYWVTHHQKICSYGPKYKLTNFGQQVTPFIQWI